MCVCVCLHVVCFYHYQNNRKETFTSSFLPSFSPSSLFPLLLCPPSLPLLRSVRGYNRSVSSWKNKNKSVGRPGRTHLSVCCCLLETSCLSIKTLTLIFSFYLNSAWKTNQWVDVSPSGSVCFSHIWFTRFSVSFSFENRFLWSCSVLVELFL